LHHAGIPTACVRGQLGQLPGDTEAPRLRTQRRPRCSAPRRQSRPRGLSVRPDTAPLDRIVGNLGQAA
jgi:hypothetical protein